MAAGPKKKSGFKKKRLDPVRIHLRKNDMVRVIAGRDRGKTGRVLEIDENTGKILVEHVGMIRRHTRPNPAKRSATSSPPFAPAPRSPHRRADNEERVLARLPKVSRLRSLSRSRGFRGTPAL